MGQRITRRTFTKTTAAATLALTATQATTVLGANDQVRLGVIEIGHRSTTMSHLANIALATESLIKWDAEREVITNNEEANDLLDYEYRKPWKLG